MTMYGNPEQCEEHPGFYKPLQEYINSEHSTEDGEKLMSILQLPKENGK